MKLTISKELLLAAYYNFHGPNFYYSAISNGYAGWGDKDTFPIAMRAMKQQAYQIPHSIDTIFLDGQIKGIGMLQANPGIPGVRSPIFLHANIIKWSIRSFFCFNCPIDPSVPNPGPSHFENSGSDIHQKLHDGGRIFNPTSFDKYGLDPEPYIWKVFEHDACRSAWGNEQLCKSTRQHMVKTFGYRFTGNGDWHYRDNVCPINP
jgi:alpha 1,2-mannosyltransferase